MCALRRFGPLLAAGNTVRAEDIEFGRAAMKPRDSAADGGTPLNELIARRVVEMIDTNGSETRDLYQKMVAEIERPLIELALERARGNQVHAARILGLNRNTLRKKITEHRIVPHKAPPG